MLQVPAHTYYVCDNFSNNTPHHEFNSIQNAIDQVQASEKAKIVVLSDFFGVPELIMNGANTDITIDGGNQCEVTFLGPVIASIGEGQALKFKNFTYIQGEEIRLAETGANFGVYDTQNMIAYFGLVPDKLFTNIHIYNTRFFGWSAHPAINIENIETGIEIFNSLIEGSVGNPAIVFNVEANGKLKIKNSVVLHGSIGAPIQVATGLFVDVYIYNCFGKEKIVNNPLNNLIVINNNNISDENISF
jgi:hypothetical protein